MGQLLLLITPLPHGVQAKEHQCDKEHQGIAKEEQSLQMLQVGALGQAVVCVERLREKWRERFHLSGKEQGRFSHRESRRWRGPRTRVSANGADLVNRTPSTSPFRMSSCLLESSRDKRHDGQMSDAMKTTWYTIWFAWQM